MVSGERYKVIMDHLVAFATAYDIELFSNPFDSQCGTLQFPVAVCGPHVHRRWWEIVVGNLRSLKRYHLGWSLPGWRCKV